MISENSLKEITFRGQIVDGMKEGHGICEYTDSIVYEG